MSLTPFIATPKFEDYKERFKNHYKLERRADGVILAQAHTVGGPIQSRTIARSGNCSRPSAPIRKTRS